MKTAERSTPGRGLILTAFALLILSGCSSDTEKARADLRDRLAEAERQAADLLRTAEAVKKEWDQINRGTTRYDLVVHAGGDEAGRINDHEAALKAMDHVEVRDVAVAGVGVQNVRVGCSDVKVTGTGGTGHERHFRAIWTEGERKVGISYHTDRQTDLAAFTALLGRLVPVVNRHVAVKKGS